MTMLDDQFLTSTEHRTASAIRDMMTAIGELADIAHDGHGMDLISQSIDDLELSYARLGQLLRATHEPDGSHPNAS